MPFTTVTAAVTVTPTEAPTVVVVTATVSPSDLTRFPSFSLATVPTASPTPSPISSPSSTSTGQKSSAIDGGGIGSSSSSDSSSNASLVGAVAGGLIGGFAFFTLLIVMACLIRRRARQGRGIAGRKGAKGRRTANAGGYSVAAGGVGGARGNQAPTLALNRGVKAAGVFQARPGLYGRAGTHSSSDSSALVSLIGVNGAAAASHLAVGLDHHGAHTPSSSMNSTSRPRYSLLSAHPSSVSHENFDPYAFEAGMVDSRTDVRASPSAYDRDAGHSIQPSGHFDGGSTAHSMGRLASQGSSVHPASGSSAALNRPSSGTNAAYGASNSGGRQNGSAGSSLSFVQPSRQSRPVSASSNASTARGAQPSIGHASSAYSTSAAAYALPTPASGASRGHHQQMRPDDDEMEMLSRTAAAHRPPVAGKPLRPSDLSTIQGSVSERTTERSNSSVSGTTIRHAEGASNAPRLPSTPASSPLIHQEPSIMPQDRHGDHSKLAGAKSDAPSSRLVADATASGTHVSSRSGGSTSKGLSEGTLDSTGTFNTFTGQRKADLHVVGTLSSQASTLLSIVDHANVPLDAADVANSSSATPGVVKPIGHLTDKHPRDGSSVDSQGLEFWLNSEIKPKGDREGQNPGVGSPDEREGLDKAMIAQTSSRKSRSAHERSSSSARGSRLIEMFEPNDAADDVADLVPSDLSTSRSGLALQSADVAGGDIGSPSRPHAKRTSSLSNLLRLSASPKADSTALPAVVASEATPAADEPELRHKPKRISSSPLQALGSRLSKPFKSSTDHADESFAAAQILQLSLDDQPPLHYSAPASRGAVGSFGPSSVEKAAKHQNASQMRRTPSRESAVLLSGDFFSAATFAQPLTVPTIVGDGRSEGGAVVSIQPQQAIHTGSSLTSRNGVSGNTTFSDTAKIATIPSKGGWKVNGSKGKVKHEGGKSNEIDIDQLF